jgi:outer membrane protein TolC
MLMDPDPDYEEEILTVAPAKSFLGAAVAALLLTAPVAAQDGPKAVTLDQALAMAERVSPSVLQAQGSVRSAELSTRQQIWQFLPNLTFRPQADLSLSSGKSRLDPVTQEVISGNQTTPSYGMTVSGSLTLFDGFQRQHQLTARRAAERVADANLVSTRFSMMLTTTTAFFDALQAQKVLRVSEGSVAQNEEQLKVAAAKLQTGAGQRSDSLSAFVSLSQAKLNLLQAQANLATAEANLGRYIGVEGRVTAVDDSSFYREPSPIDTAALRAEVLATSPQVRTSAANVTSAQANYRAAKSAYWPTLSMNASNSWTAQKTNSYSLEPRRSLGISFSFSPWTSFSRETQVENASISIDNAEANLADLRRSLNAQLTSSFATLANAEQSVAVAGLAVDAAQENVRVMNERYKLGVATIIELLQVQQALTQAEVNQVQAQYSYLRAKAQLESIAGRKL